MVTQHSFTLTSPEARLSRRESEVYLTNTYYCFSKYNAAFQVISVLSRILLCRSATLKGHIYKCPGCQDEKNVYNSCTDRHCPQCGGAKRADGLDKTRELILPKVNYFQVVFTLPDKLSGLILGNRKELYDLLFHSAWGALDKKLREQQFKPAAHLVLHT